MWRIPIAPFCLPPINQHFSWQFDSNSLDLDHLNSSFRKRNDWYANDTKQLHQCNVRLHCEQFILMLPSL
jgi:hypothetical protein